MSEQEKPETHAAVIAEMHKYAQECRVENWNTPPEMERHYNEDDVDDLADRLEAAHRRECGDSAKLREALSDACYAMFNFLKSQTGGYEEMANALDKAKAALASTAEKSSAVGNAAAMREALVEISKFADDWESYAHTKAGALDRIYELAQAALAEPPRNCDIHTDFKDAITTLADERNWHDGKWDSERYCILASWLLAPATEQEGDDK